MSGLGATNRHTRYRKADLDAWREGLVSFATHFQDFDDLAADAPWIVEGDKIAGHMLDMADIDAVLAALISETVIFLRLDEALQRPWATGGARSVYQEAFDAICLEMMRIAADAGQREALEKETGPAPGGSKGPVRP